ncbi:thioredoxin fold domain-containing protein [Pectobacterium parvum]|uniref:thioredoxin fold domain-containing protein n=1 Tax=Pectobacterium parvum TaxID=2778550 RepID=UPI000DC64919|nr:thioredoxin fold domain-containing protein [Pectobacterium parvum]
MTISHKDGPFVAEIFGGQLSARRYQPAEECGNDSELFTSCSSNPIFIFPLVKNPWFVIHGERLYAQNEHESLTPVYQGNDAVQLLSCITSLLATAESKRKRFRVKGICVGAVMLGLLAWFTLAPFDGLSKLRGLSEAVALTTVDESGEVRSLTPQPTHQDIRKSAPVKSIGLDPSMNAPSAVPTDGWSLPLHMRAELPSKLKNAAARGLFTVPLSSGHSRTIYVFADPECSNCQRMERHFEAAADLVNVVIFPVTIEGGTSSLETLTQVMALPEASRANAWRNLFSADTGISVPGGTQASLSVMDETQAETARAAIGVNEVAFRAYRLPGTPWTISDDGRYVSQAVLSSPSALTTFLTGGAHDGQ